MSNNVKISYAYDKENDRQISVHKAEKGKDYECLECRGILRKKGGEGTTRREHFFHKTSNTNCSISEETNLHNGSKLYLKECLEDGKDPIISFNTDILPDIKLRLILNKAKIKQFRISADDLMNGLMKVSKDEDKIDGSNFIGDVISRNVDDKSIAMIWEIKVTHEIEPEKRQWLEQNKIPYIELKPSEYEFDEFKYEVVSFGNIELFKKDNFSLDSIREIYNKDICLDNLRYLKEFFNTINKKIVEQPVQITDLKWADDYRNCVKEFINNNKIIKIKQSYYNEKNISKSSFEKIELRDIQIRRSEIGEFLVFNNIKADSFTSLAGEFFRIIGNELGAMGLLNDKNELYGVKIDYLDNKFNIKNILIPKMLDFIKGIKFINLAFMKFNKKSKKYEFNSGNCSQVSFPDSTDMSIDELNEKIRSFTQNFNNNNKNFKIQNLKIQEQSDSNILGENSFFNATANIFKMTLEELLNKGVKIDIIIQKSSKGDELVTGFYINNIYSISKYNILIEDFGSRLANQWIKDFCM